MFGALKLTRSENDSIAKKSVSHGFPLGKSLPQSLRRWAGTYISRLFGGSRLSECGKRFAERSRCPPASRPSRRPPRHTRIPSALAAHHVAAQPTGAATAPWEYPARARKTSKSGTSSFVGKVYEITGRFCALCSKVGLVQFLAWNSKRVSEWIRALPGKPWFAQRFPPVSGNSAP